LKKYKYIPISKCNNCPILDLPDGVYSPKTDEEKR